MKKLLSILLVLAMVISLGLTAFAEGEKDEPDLKTFLSELAEKDKVTEEDLSELLPYCRRDRHRSVRCRHEARDHQRRIPYVL